MLSDCPLCFPIFEIEIDLMCDCQTLIYLALCADGVYRVIALQGKLI